jgi:hypothetical protein
MSSALFPTSKVEIIESNSQQEESEEGERSRRKERGERREERDGGAELNTSDGGEVGIGVGDFGRTN